VRCYEADISEEIKFLNKLYGKKRLSVNMDDFNVCIIDIEVESPNEFPKPEQSKFPINLITVWFSKSNKTFTFGNREYTGDNIKNYWYCKDEKRMLEEFINFFRKKQCDFLSGWYNSTFDIPYIVNRCKNLNIDYTKLSPFNIVKEKHGKKGLEYSITGISILDYVYLYKKFVKDPKESYSLNAVAIDEINEGKLDYEGSINNAWQVDWNKFAEYNVQDVLLVKKLDQKLRFFQLVVTICYDALIPFELVFSTLPMHTGYIYRFLHNQNMVMPMAKKNKHEEYPGAYVYAKTGLHKYIISYDVVSEYPHMIMQYNIGPETLRLDPENTEGLIKTPLSEYKVWKTASGEKEYGGIYYDGSKQSILSQVTEKIFKERKLFKLKMNICRFKNEGLSKDNICDKLNIDKDRLDKLIEQIDDESGNKDYYDIGQYVRKIQINSLYGAVANKFFHFYDINNATAITLGGQSLIKLLAGSVNNYLKNHFYKNKKYFDKIQKKHILTNNTIVLLDTDSIYIRLEEVIQKLNLKFKDNMEFIKWANKFCKSVLDPFFKQVLDKNAKKYNVENIIEFKREKIADKMIIPAKKRYVINVLDDEGLIYDEPKVKEKGIEIVRTDTPSFCRKRIKDTVKEIFKNTDPVSVQDYMVKVKKDFKNDKIENIAIPKGLSDYQKYGKIVEKGLKNDKGLTIPKGCPIHCRAAIHYNYLVSKYNLSLQKINNGTKMRFIYVQSNNELNTDIIGFVGNYPDKFKELFKIDYERQWIKTFQNVIQRLFDAMDWETISLDNKLKKFFT
jgi:DNA polymerase elongation subunit (family B)